MAYQYDQMGNIVGEYETEEERRKREAELANTAVQTHEVKTYGDGSQTQTVKQEIPAGAVAGPVAPAMDETAAETARLARQNVQAPGVPIGAVAAPIAPTRSLTAGATPEEQAAYIAQQESGNRPNIGYHDVSKGTAYGTYGITAPAYADVQRTNPAFAGRPIESLTPEEQTKAYQTYTAMNAGQLQRTGIEPTPGNLAAAHFLGATGLKNYLATGEISPAAAAANGGVENARRIVEGRLAQGAAPSSGAVAQAQPAAQPVTAPVAPGEQYSLATGTTGLGLQAPGAAMGQPVQAEHPAMPAINAYQAAQSNPMELLKLRNDETQPTWIRERAGRQASDLMRMEIDKKDAEAKLTPLLASAAQGDPKAANQIAKTLQSQEGSWAKMILLGFISPQLAGEEAIKLGFGNKWAPAQDAQGNAGLIEYNAKGLPLKGTKADGTAMTSNELTAFASQGVGKAADVSLTPHQAIVNGEVHTISTKRTAQGIQYRDDTAGTGWSTTAPAGLTNVGAHNPQELAGLKTKQQIEAKMRKDNTGAIAATGRPLYSEEQIAAQGNQGYSSITGKQFAGAPAAAAGGPVAPGQMPAAAAQPAPVAQAAPQATAQAAPQATAPAKGPKTIAQQILDYEAPAPAGPTTPAKLAILNEVNRLAAEQGKTYDGAQYKIAAKTRQDFTTGVQGKAVQAMNVGIDHLDTLQTAANALGNGQIPIFNDIAQKYAKNTGSSAPTDFNALKSIVGSEVAKAVTGGASALGDREEIRAEIDRSNSPQQLAGVINRYQQLMAGQVKGLRQTYESAGLKDFDAKLLDRTKVVLNKTTEPKRSNW